MAATLDVGNLNTAKLAETSPRVMPTTPTPVQPTPTTVQTMPATQPTTTVATRTLGVMVGGSVVPLEWAINTVPSLDTIKAKVYGARTSLRTLPDILLQPQQPSDVALALPHDYYYVIPLGIAQALQALGDYANAETYYLQAASYQYINAAIEVPFVWIALANLYLQWGNSLFQDGDAPGAAPVYGKVIGIDDSVPAAKLYTLANLAPAVANAKTVIADLVAGTAIPNTINPLLAAPIVAVRGQLAKIKAGLDYYGMAANTVPIWTFAYLQSVAINFANLALNAEQSLISFQARADDATVTKTQLQQTVAQAQGDVQAASMQAAAAQAEQQAYQDGVALANQRAADATAAVGDYSSQSWHQNVMQAESSQVQGGDDGDPGKLVDYLNQLRSGATISDSGATVAAALSLDAATYARQYEIDQLQRTADELHTAAAQAQAEASAAQVRVAAANAEVTVAQLRASGAQQVLAAFDSAFFTPDVWHAMAQTMYGLYERYFGMALKVAKTMQAAYNFETDQSLHVIRSSYAGGEVKGLLGADLLMADIQGFTYDLITSTAGKQQPLRHEISLATSYPYLFEKQFRKTGAMDFETRVDDFDAAYPGTYAGRIASVEVAVDGIVPVLGLSGTLTNNGVSTYRVPSAAWPSNGSPGVKFRIQPKETLVLSDYGVRNDDLLYRGNADALRIFEGAGVASSWHLEIPKATNDIDYGALTDVRLIFYYDARYDGTLKSRVLSHLAALPGVTQRARGLPLAWLYPGRVLPLPGHRHAGDRAGEIRLPAQPARAGADRRRAAGDDRRQTGGRHHALARHARARRGERHDRRRRRDRLGRREPVHAARGRERGRHVHDHDAARPQRRLRQRRQAGSLAGRQPEPDVHLQLHAARVGRSASVPSGVDSQVLSLPKGGGAVSDVGTAFETDLNTGTGSYAFPLTLPAGPDGIVPQLRLRYSSGAGNGPFGIGWAFGTMAVQRATDHGIPTYAPGDDAFAMPGVDDLLDIGGGAYRPRVDTMFYRILRSGAAWEVTDTAGTVYALGASAAGRVGTTVDGNERVGLWLLETMTTAAGNVITYRYAQDGAQRYVSTVAWGRYRLDFVYEDRPDRLSDGSFGFLIRTARRCARIELHALDAAPTLVKSWNLAYTAAEPGGLSLLASITVRGHGADGATLDAPPMAFGYTAIAPRTLTRCAGPVPGASPPPFSSGAVELVDWDGDGLPELFELRAGSARVWRNRGRNRWGYPLALPSLPGPLDLAQPGVAFADLLGTGTTDLVAFASAASRYVPLQEGGGFGRAVTLHDAPPVAGPGLASRFVDLDGDGRIDVLTVTDEFFALYYRENGGYAARPQTIPRSAAPPVDLRDPHVKLADMTGDGLQDLVRVDGAGVRYWPYLGHGRWADEVVMTSPPLLPRGYDPRRLFAVDVDGDGCADFVYVDAGRVTVWYNRGGVAVGAPQTIAATPAVGIDEVRLVDLNGSGTMGVLWSNVPDGPSRRGYVYLDLCGGTKPYLLHTIDNGIGTTTTISYRSSTEFALDAAEAGEPWRTFHPFPVHCVAAMSVRDAATGVTARTRYVYGPARYDSAVRAFLGFATVDTITDGDGTVPGQRTRNTYHLGLDPSDLGRPLSGDDVLRFGALRRRLLETAIFGLDGGPDEDKPYRVVGHAYGARIEVAPNGARVGVGFETTATEMLFERAATPFSTHTITYAEPDAFGNIASQRMVAQRAGMAQPDQDVTTATTFAQNLAAHVVSLPARVTQTLADGSVASAKVMYYDGPGFVGLPEGQATSGHLSRIDVLAFTDPLVGAIYGASPPDLAALGYARHAGEPGWWITHVAYERRPAADGFTLARRNQLGFEARIVYDAGGSRPHTLIDEAGNTIVAGFDERAMQIGTLTDGSGATTRDAFDLLGRVTATISPGDTDALPSAAFEYRLAATPTALKTSYRTTSGQAATFDELELFDGRGQRLSGVVPGEGGAGRAFIVRNAVRRNVRGLEAALFEPYYADDASGHAPPPGTPSTALAYDGLGRLLVRTEAGGAITRYAYAPGTVTITNSLAGEALERITVQRLDALGRIVAVEQALGGRTLRQTFTYTPQSHIASATDADGITTRLGYDLLGRLVANTTPATGTTYSVADAAGNVVTRRNAAGEEIASTFDGLGRLLSTGPAGGPAEVTYHYLNAGDPAPPDGERNRRSRLWRVDDALGTWTYTYDARGQVTGQTRTLTAKPGITYATDFVLDGMGRQLSTTLPEPLPGAGRRVVGYTYGPRGVPVAAPGYVKSAEYDLRGRLTSLTYQNGTTNNWTYLPSSQRLQHLGVSGPAGQTLRDQTFQYDGAGNTTGIASPDPLEHGTFGYDDLDRLTSASYGDGNTFAYAYSDGGTVAPAAPGAGTFDAAGRMVHGAFGTLAYDGFDRLHRRHAARRDGRALRLRLPRHARVPRRGRRHDVPIGRRVAGAGRRAGRRVGDLRRAADRRVRRTADALRALRPARQRHAVHRPRRGRAAPAGLRAVRLAAPRLERRRRPAALRRGIAGRVHGPGLHGPALPRPGARVLRLARHDRRRRVHAGRLEPLRVRAQQPAALRRSLGADLVAERAGGDRHRDPDRGAVRGGVLHRRHHPARHSRPDRHAGRAVRLGRDRRGRGRRHRRHRRGPSRRRHLEGHPVRRHRGRDRRLRQRRAGPRGGERDVVADVPGQRRDRRGRGRGDRRGHRRRRRLCGRQRQRGEHLQAHAGRLHHRRGDRRGAGRRVGHHLRRGAQRGAQDRHAGQVQRRGGAGLDLEQCRGLRPEHGRAGGRRQPDGPGRFVRRHRAVGRDQLGRRRLQRERERRAGLDPDRLGAAVPLGQRRRHLARGHLERARRERQVLVRPAARAGAEHGAVPGHRLRLRDRPGHVVGIVVRRLAQRPLQPVLGERDLAGEPLGERSHAFEHQLRARRGAGCGLRPVPSASRSPGRGRRSRRAGRWCRTRRRRPGPAAPGSARRSPRPRCSRLGSAGRARCRSSRGTSRRRRRDSAPASRADRSPRRRRARRRCCARRAPRRRRAALRGPARAGRGPRRRRRAARSRRRRCGRTAPAARCPASRAARAAPRAPRGACSPVRASPAARPSGRSRSASRPARCSRCARASRAGKSRHSSSEPSPSCSSTIAGRRASPPGHHAVSSRLPSTTTSCFTPGRRPRGRAARGAGSCRSRSWAARRRTRSSAGTCTARGGS